jgi:hypothetical protein
LLILKVGLEASWRDCHPLTFGSREHGHGQSVLLEQRGSALDPLINVDRGSLRA